jgi:hypothetical protein
MTTRALLAVLLGLAGSLPATAGAQAPGESSRAAPAVGGSARSRRGRA